ncbi:unnamed protein product [Paramecium sonneborni]|uniref:HSF-type DNA-binding domain-containing protein n=1 Tax=Paramecium sonneborni TaxID=65129 RepID=A0A8S1Q4N6_9CILI|nr:unnamed protein product [Paramecium sonneborni]
MSNLDPIIYPHLKMNVPSFLIKTYEILEDESIQEIISWNKEGTAFIVYNSHELSSKVLANYFKHKNYPSFLRQLNMYNFKKTRNQYGASEFRHKWFRKGQKNMIQYIRRRNQEESDLKVEARDQNQEFDTYKKEHENMKILLYDLQETHKIMSNNLAKSIHQSTEMNRQNFITFQNIQKTQLEFNKKYEYLSIMLTNVLNNLPNILTNFREMIKICQDDSNLQQTQYSLENGTSYQNPQVMSYNQFQFYAQKQKPFYFYNEKQQYFYNNTPQLAITDKQSNFCSPTTYSLQSSQPNSPYRISNNQQYLLDYSNIDQQYQQV